MKTLELQTRRLRTANDDDDDAHEDKRISITRRGCLSPFPLKATKHWAILNYQRSWKQRKSSNFLAMSVEELKRSRDFPRNRYLQESIHVEDSFLLDHERFTNHQKNHKKLQNDFHNSKRLSHECQPTNLSWSAENNKATNGISLFCFWNQASNDKERAAGRQAGRQEEIRINNTTSTSTIIIQSTSI